MIEQGTNSRISEACNAAEKLRRQWDAGVRPARDLLSLCELHGVLVLRAAIAEELSGAFVRSRRIDLGVIVVNTSGRNTHHQRFTLAHELGHLRLHEDLTGLVDTIADIEDEKSAAEKEANAFAAAFLVPLKELKRELKDLAVSPTSVPDRIVVGLASRYGVSHHVILRRLRILADLPYSDVRRRLDGTDWSALWRKHAPESYPETRPGGGLETWRLEGVSNETAQIISRFPQKYREMAFEAYRRGLITAGKLAELLWLPDRRAVIEELRPILLPELQAEQDLLEKMLGDQRRDEE